MQTSVYVNPFVFNEDMQESDLFLYSNSSCLNFTFLIWHGVMQATPSLKNNGTKK